MTAKDARALHDAKIENPEFVDIPKCVKDFIDVAIYMRIFRDNSNNVEIKVSKRMVNASYPVGLFVSENMDVVAKYLEQRGFKVETSSDEFYNSLNIEW